MEIEREEVEKEEEEREEERGAERGVRERRASAELDRRAFIVSYSEVSANVPQVGHSMPAAYNRGNEVRQKGKCGVEGLSPGETKSRATPGFGGTGEVGTIEEQRQMGRDNYRMTGEWRDWGERRGKSLVRCNGELFDAPLLTAEKRRSRMSRDSDERELHFSVDLPFSLNLLDKSPDSSVYSYLRLNFLKLHPTRCAVEQTLGGRSRSSEQSSAAAHRLLIRPGKSGTELYDL